MQYFYKKLGRVVEIGQMFDTHWNYTDPNDPTTLVRQGLVEDFTPVADSTGEPGRPHALEATSRDWATPVLPNDWGKSETVEETTTPTPGFVKLINLNSENSPAVIGLHLPGIGKVTAKKICDRRPRNGGYKDFDHFRKINTDLHLDEEAWEKVKELVEF